MTRAIAYISHPYHRGGVTYWMAQAARESVRQGIECYFVTVVPSVPFISNGGNLTLVEVLQSFQEKVTLITTEVDHSFELGTDDYRAYVYSELIRKLPKGTVTIVSDDPSVWMGAAMNADKYPMLAVIHSSMDLKYYELLQRYERYLSAIVSVSSRVADKVRSLLVNKSIPVSIIPCGIPVSVYEQAERRVKNSSVKNILWVGRVEETSKRISDVPLIAKKLKDKIEFNIEVIGSGPDYQSLLNEIEVNKLQNVITCSGWRDTAYIIQQMKEADLLVQTSNYEGMSITVMEALAAGCPVVSTRVSGVEDYEKGNEEWLKLYSNGSIDEAVMRITETFKSDPVKISEGSVQLALREFSIEVCVKRYNSIVNDIQELTDTVYPIRNVLIVKSISYIKSQMRFWKYRLLAKQNTLIND